MLQVIVSEVLKQTFAELTVQFWFSTISPSKLYIGVRRVEMMDLEEFLAL